MVSGEDGGSLNSKVFVFFDIGHTLVAGGEMSPRRLLAYKLNLSEKAVKEVGRLIMTAPLETPEEVERALKPFTSHIDSTRVGQIIRDIWEEQMFCVELLPGVGEVLEHLKSKGIGLGLLSNIWHPFYEGFKKKYPQILEFFSNQVLSYRERMKKPSLDIYYTARRMSGASQCWMVGDSYEMDIEPAGRAGFKTLWFVLRPEREREKIVKIIRGEATPPDFAVSDFREIHHFFGSLIG